MAGTSITRQRLIQQRLTHDPLATPAVVVAWMGAVQAQEYEPAKWALSLRMQHPADDVIEQAFTEGAILRTHVLRPTWHFVTPDDIRWLLDLTGPRVHAMNASMYRRYEIDDALIRRSNVALEKALAGGQQLTRAELGAALADAGIIAEGLRLTYIVFHAELDGLVCSGARRGRQFTYALLNERAPHARRLRRDEALAELTQRYFTSHGPATLRDFAWWSGLTQADAKIGLEMVKESVVQEEIDGTSYWLSASIPPVALTSPQAFLLPTYDEFVIGYTDRSALFEASPDAADGSSADATPARSAFLFQDAIREKIVYDSMIVIDGQIVGSWRRSVRKGAVIIDAAPLRPFTEAEQAAFEAAARRLGDFLGMPVEIV